jgi:hypothetical protein
VRPGLEGETQPAPADEDLGLLSGAREAFTTKG